MRIRSIKPDFFQDDDLAALPAMTRLLYIGLWCLADGHGRMEDRPSKIKISILPYDEWDINRALDELATAKFVIRYQAGDKKYIQVRTFSDHQRITGKEAETPSKYPAPTGDISRDRLQKARGSNGETSGNQSGNSQCPGGEGKGKEGKGENNSPPPLADDLFTPGQPPVVSPADRERYELNEVKVHGGDVAAWNRLQWVIVLKLWTLPTVLSALDELPIKARSPKGVDAEIRKNHTESRPELEAANKFAEENADYLIEMERNIAAGKL